MPEKDVLLVLLETSGNQAYIFSTNKLRDVVGASELTHRVGTRFVEESVREVFGRDFFVDQLLQEPDIASEASKGVEVVVATSGKAVLLVQGRDMARRLISAWSRRVFLEAPGVDATGVVSSAPVDLQRAGDGEGSVAWALRDAHEEFERARALRTAPASRWMRLPVVAPCRDSGLPANALWRGGEGVTPISRSSLAKRQAAASEEFRERMGRLGGNLRGFSNPQEMEDRMEGLEWLGVIHADGNGLGEIFLNFHSHVGEEVGKSFGRHYLDVYRRFSVELDEACREAYKETTARVFEKSSGRVPVVPVVVGGDDLTVILDGARALDFAAYFVRSFCRKTGKKGTISAVAHRARARLGAPRLGMAAGVAVVKPHFPFSSAYDFAEELMGGAKDAKKKASFAAGSIDFHIVYDSTVSSIREVRGPLHDSEICRTAKPYVVEPVEAPIDAAWQRDHDFRRFANAVRALGAKNRDDQKPLLPPHQSHGTRANLFSESRETQEREWEILCRRYGEFAALWKGDDATSGGGLFFETKDRDGQQVYATVFLDAIEALGFLDVGNWEEDEGRFGGGNRR